LLAGGLEWADPTDLDGLREALELADPEGRLAPVGMSRVEIGDEALGLLPEVVSEFAGGPRVVLVVDPTPMRRDGDDLKSGVERLLRGRFEVRRAAIGEGRGAPHADEAALDETAAAVSGADCVVVVGSGTITDVAKEATTRAGTPPLVVVQTGASVNAFSNDMAVLLKSGTKRLGVPARNTLLVGDRLATDIRLANEYGMAGALVLTGATTLDEAFLSADRPDYILGGLADLLPPRGAPRTAARAPESRED